MKFIITIFICFAYLKALSQPGGGGGIILGHYYTSSLRLISNKDTLLKVRNFVLIKVGAEDVITQELYSDKYRIEESFNYPNTYTRETYPNQRLLITYGSDTMLLDVYGIISGNGMGYTDRIDKLIIRPGHYRYTIDRATFNPYNAIKSKDIDLKNVQDGIPDGAITIDTAINIKWLAEDHLPAVFFLRRARQNLLKAQFESALGDANTALHKGLNAKQCEEAYYYQFEGWTGTGDSLRAIDAISSAISITRNREALLQYYAARMIIYLKTQKIPQALEDYKRHYLLADEYDATDALSKMMSLELFYSSNLRIL